MKTNLKINKKINIKRVIKIFSKMIAHFLFLFGLLVVFLLPKNKYEWMKEADSSILDSPIDHDSGAKIIVKTLILICMIFLQLGIITLSENQKEKLISVILILSAIFIYLLRVL